eukprot:6033413-Karenia_brevis.AAC.1
MKWGSEAGKINTAKKMKHRGRKMKKKRKTWLQKNNKMRLVWRTPKPTSSPFSDDESSVSYVSCHEGEYEHKAVHVVVEEEEEAEAE